MGIDRSELVTAALLGTDRRPADFLGPATGVEPAQALLAYAARSAVEQRAGAFLPVAPAVARGPADLPPPAPPAAQALLAGLLARSVAELVGIWLRLAADRGVGVAPEHWTSLLALANRQNPSKSRHLSSSLMSSYASTKWCCRT